AADIETALVIHDLMLAVGIERFTIRINNRLVLNGLLEQLGLAAKAKALLIALDKLGKAGGRGAVRHEMVEKAGIAAGEAEGVLDLAETQGTNAEILSSLQKGFGDNPKAAEGIVRLRELLDIAGRAGVSEDRLRLDLSIARGLDYYTGTVYETFLSDLP